MKPLKRPSIWNPSISHNNCSNIHFRKQKFITSHDMQLTTLNAITIVSLVVIWKVQPLCYCVGGNVLWCVVQLRPVSTLAMVLLLPLLPLPCRHTATTANQLPNIDLYKRRSKLLQILLADSPLHQDIIA